MSVIREKFTKCKIIMMAFLQRDIVRNSSIYVLSNFITASIPFFLLPILTTCLTTADYGITAMFQVVVSFMIPLVGLNAEAAVSVEYYTKKFKDIGRYIGNCLLLSLCSFSVMMVIAILFVDTISSFTEIPYKWLYLAFIQSFFQFICTLALILWQVSKKAIHFGIFQILMGITNAVLSIWFVYYLDWNYEGRLAANFIVVSLFSAIAAVYVIIYYKVSFHISRNIIKDIVYFGIPLIPHVLGGWALSMIDRVFLADMVGLDAVGKYSAAFQIASVMSFLTVAVNQAFVPWLFEKLKNINDLARKQIVRYSYLYMIGLVVCAVCFILIFPLIQQFMLGENFSGIGFTFTVLIFGFVFQGFYMTFTNYITFVKKTKYQAAITLCVGVLKLPVTFLFIKYFGAIGAAIAYSTTYFLFFVITAIVSNKLYPMPWGIKNAI